MKKIFLSEKTKNILKKSVFFLDMKRRYKFLAFFAALFIAAYFCMPPLESVVKKAVNYYGSQITGTNVSIDGLDIKLRQGEAHVKGIKVGNPKEYSTENLFYLKDIGVRINISSLTEDTVVIESIDIQNPEITYEMLSLVQNNVSDILSNVNKNTASSQKQTKSDSSSGSTKENAPSKKLIIKNLTISDGHINVVAGLGQSKQTMILPLPTIVMKNIGAEQNGASVAETISKVLTNLLNKVSTTVLNANTDKLKDLKNAFSDSASKGLDDVKNQAKSLSGSVKSLFK